MAGLIVLTAHTGLRFGANLNFALMCMFVATNFVGAFAGIATGREDWLRTPEGIRWRRWLTCAHVVLTWPLPMLVGFHILSVYYF
jgi:nitrite reductase (NADH) large subunit